MINHLRIPGGVPNEQGLSYRSPEYQRILHLRTNNAVSDLVFVEGVPAGFSPAALAREIRAMRNSTLQEV